MSGREERSDLLSALTTEHFVMQTSISAALNEAQSRANMFIGTLSGALVSLGFAVQVEAAFLPFVATVLPAVFLMGVITTLRLVDIAAESMQAEIAIARIHEFYRSLDSEAQQHFARENGRWPEGRYNSSLRLGTFIAYWTTAASMIAMLDGVVGAAGVALLAHRGGGLELSAAMSLGAALAAVLLTAFYFYQRARIGELATAGMRFAADAAGTGATKGGSDNAG